MKKRHGYIRLCFAMQSANRQFGNAVFRDIIKLACN